MATDLGEQPTPEIEPAEPPPGGVDAVDDVLYEEQPLVPDMSRLGNEGAKDAPAEVTEPEDTDTEATDTEVSDTERTDSDAQQEDPA
jgi:hypothetical protein